jgi:hypothetical protein
VKKKKDGGTGGDISKCVVRGGRGKGARGRAH